MFGFVQLRIMTEPQQGASYDDLLAVAQQAEELGFDGFFRSDHYKRIGAGDPLPGPTDAWATLAGIARETSTIRLGTMVTPATFRLPGPLAITVATVDAMSGGRVELGFGMGWYAQEHASYAIPFPEPAERFARFAEQLEILDGLWRTPVGQTFSYLGRFYELTDSPALPKPAQQPRPPIIVGGHGKRRSAALAARFANEYNTPFRSVESTATVFEAVRAAAGPRALVYSAVQTLCVGRNDAEVTRRAEAIGRRVEAIGRDPREPNGMLIGTPAQVVDQIGQFAAIGAERLYLQVIDLADREHLELVSAIVMPQV